MRNLKLTWGMLTCLVFLTFSACQKEEDPEAIDFTAPEYQLANLGEVETPVVSGTPEISDFRCRPTDSTRTNALVLILQQLRLDENQRKAVKGFVKQHHTCVADHLVKIHELHLALIKRANATREEHVKAFQNGTITREQLVEKLTALRAALREELIKNEVKRTHLLALVRCRIELIKNIGSVLNQEQLKKWNHWKENHR